MEMFMLFTTAILLLASFDITWCQRKVSRNVAVGSDVKAVANFNCPEEFGYYPHPSDCTQYYVCVFGGALLESCTGGLMYSHELQTCDWPRNVGCDGAELSSSISVPSSSPPSRTREEPRTRYTPPTPPPPQPSAIVTSRGQPRQLHHSQQEIIKQRQQQQLYAEAEETLPPADEIESDRQQRVYRGQPSTVGQVQKDRDGLRHSNAIPSYSGRGERIGVISFGTQQQQYSSSKIDDLLTNDLTMKKRRKRQTQRSRHRSSDTPWRASRQNFKASRPYNLEALPLQTPFYSSSYQQNDDGFMPFIPNYYQRIPTHTIANSYNLYKPSNNKPYLNQATQRSVSRLRELDEIKHLLNNYRDENNIMLPQNIHLVNYNTSLKTNNSNINPLIPSTTVTTIPIANENSSEEQDANNKSFSEYSELNHKFGPPPSYFNTKNRYENIENPFANPDFDFDKFLDNLRGDRLVVKPKSKSKDIHPVKMEETKSNSTEFVKNKYYNDYEVKTPKKIYSSQIKPTVKVGQPIDDEYYYDEDYDYSEENNVPFDDKIVNVTTKIPETTYIISAIESTTKKLLTSETYVTAYTSPITVTTSTSTTQRPKHTIRQTIPTTRPSRSKQRQRLTDNDTKPRVEQSSAAPAPPPVSTATATARTLYNSSQYNSNNYDPYYALYDDDVELYRDVDYSQHYNSNSNNNNNNNAQQSYRRTPSPVIQSTTAQEESPKRGNSAYIQNNYNSQDIYQPSTVADYNEDNSYNSQVDDQNSYRQINRQSSRGDRNDLNYIEEATTKRTTTTTTFRKPTTTTTRTTTSRTIPPKKSTVPRLPVTANENKTQAQSIINTLREGPGQNPTSSTTITTTTTTATTTTNPPHNSSLGLDEIITYRPRIPVTTPKILSEAVVKKPAPFTLPQHLTTEKPTVFHYITKSSRSTTLVSTELPKLTTENSYTKIIPTTYSPPKFFLKSLLPKSTTYSTSISQVPDTKQEHKSHKTLKAVRKLISPINVNYGLSSVTASSYESAEKLISDVDSTKNILSHHKNNDLFESTTKITKLSTTSESLTSSKPITRTVSQKNIQNIYDDGDDDDDDNDHNDNNYDVNSRDETKLRHYIEPYSNNNVSSVKKRFRTTIEIPQPHDLVDDSYRQKQEPDQSPDYKLKPIPKPSVRSTTTTTDSPSNSPIPARVSRVNTAIKSLIAFGGTRRQNIKCHENQSADTKCNDPKQRTSTRGRGSTHYGNGVNIANNEVTVTINRGTPASRSRPTLKPSTSIVSKAAEFIDIYRYPPYRPEAIYPQPQPDKTAAKCRKDVCLLPDCSCGGKEIPGDLPVEQVPQIVLLTFDDSVNDLNKGLYSDLFEKGRVNPNGCPIAATFYVSHEWTDYSQVQNLYSDGHEIASHTVSHSFGEQFSQKKWTREVAGQREILSAYGGVHLEDVRGMRAPFLSVGGNKMFKMLYDSNFTYDSSMPIYENKPPSWPYTLDYKLFHDCMIPPCPTRSYPGVWEVPMVMWQDLNGGRCSMGDACSNPPDAEGVFKMLTKNFQRHYTTNRAPFGLFYHAAWFTQPHHKEGFINFLDSILAMKDVWLVTNWQAIQWIRDPTPTSRLGSFQPFQCEYSNRPKRCNNPKVCNLWHKSGVRYMRTCQPCPDIYPWTGNTGIRSSRIDNDIED